MDSDTHETSGLGLPPPATAQSGPVNAVQPQVATAGAGGSQDDGSDILDEEWVNKAKAIVDKTKNDPYLESLELSKVRADYLKTRYNKDIKVSEDPQG